MAARINPMSAQGEQTRAAIESIALNAGSAGIKLMAIAGQLGLTRHGIDWQIARMTSVIKAATANTHKGLVFHRRFETEATAYTAACDAQMNRFRGPGLASQRNAELVLQQAGKRGMSTSELAAATGFPRASVQLMMRQLCSDGRAQWEDDVRKGKGRERRFWGRGFPTIKLQPVVSKKYVYECIRTGKRPPGQTAAQKYSAAEPIITPATRITVAPAPAPRWGTAPAERLFASVPPGSYLPADTWAARAYA